MTPRAQVYYERKTARRQCEELQEAASNEATQQDEQVSSELATAENEISEYDDEKYDLVLKVEEAFGPHYVMKERIGEGSFGQVVRAKDLRRQTEVAIKIIKSKKQFTFQAKTEIELLETLKRADPEDKHNVVRLLEHFMYRGHQCLVFELLSYNLYELLRNTHFHGVSLNLVRKFAKQILSALAFLARHDVAIIHCDLKPENVLLKHPKRSAIKVIDFGSSCRADRRMFSYIQSRFYRSPEIMLGLPYTVAIDVWSLGCILVEMHTGEPLFGGADQLDQMRKFVQVFGMPPDDMISSAVYAKRDKFFYDRSSLITSPNEPRWGLRGRPPLQQPASAAKTEPTPQASTTTSPRTLHSILGAESGGPGGRRRGEPGHSEGNYALFADFIKRTLTYSPTKRIRPEEALRHSFLNDSVWTSTTAVRASNSQAMPAYSPPPPPESSDAVVGGDKDQDVANTSNQTACVQHDLDATIESTRHAAEIAATTTTSRSGDGTSAATASSTQATFGASLVASQAGLPPHQSRTDSNDVSASSAIDRPVFPSESSPPAQAMDCDNNDAAQTVRRTGRRRGYHQALLDSEAGEDF